MMTSVNQKLDCTEDSLGLLVADDKANKKFYFIKTSSGGNIFGAVTDKSKQMFSYATTTAKTVVTMNALIELAGGIIVNSVDDVSVKESAKESVKDDSNKVSKETSKVDYVDLTLENIVKDTIVNIVAGGK